jgi:ADP-ribose pyrophosphatase YjhB (NUDIX family)
MLEQPTISHHIQKYIIGMLMYHETARFRDLRPPKTETNLFSYHLNLLLKSGLIAKTPAGYALSPAGLSYVDRVSGEKQTIRRQPKIITMLLVQNSDGEVLLQKRSKQPYINSWTLPYGKLHIDDHSVVIAAQREANEKLAYEVVPKHVGDCYIRVRQAGAREEFLSTTLAHVCRFNTDDIKSSDELVWVDPAKLKQLRLAPAVEEIVARSFFNDPFFFEEFIVDYNQA